MKHNIDIRTGEPKIILHLCADEGSDTKYYAENNYDRRCIGSDIGVENYHPPPENVYGIIANPVCTMFSVARTRADTPRDLREGMRLVKECLRIIWECEYDRPEKGYKPCLQFWAIENPSTGMLRYFLGEPLLEYSPEEYGADYTKRTALWGRFNKPKKIDFYSPLKKNSSMSYKCWSGDGGGRAVCPEEFAKAFYYSNP